MAGHSLLQINASDAKYLSARPNDRVLWEGINFARDKGLKPVDFVLTDADQEGLVRYKRKHATAEKTITMLRHRPDGSPSAQDRRGRDVLRGITSLLTDDSVPDEIQSALETFSTATSPDGEAAVGDPREGCATRRTDAGAVSTTNTVVVDADRPIDDVHAQGTKTVRAAR